MKAKRRRQPAAAPAAAPGSRNAAFITAGLCLLVLAAYSNSFTAGFTLDNKQLILNDDRVHAAKTENVRLIVGHSYWWPYGESGLYRPLTTLSYLFNYAVLGNRDRPVGYHAFNLLVHVANVLLVWRLTRRLTGRESMSVATAAVWAVSPVSTEAVTNIVGRADLLAALGMLAGLHFYLESRHDAGRPQVSTLAGLMVAATIAIFSKESGVALVALIALYEASFWERRLSTHPLERAAIALVPPLLVMWFARATVLAGAAAPEFPFVDNPIGGAGFWVGRATAVKVMVRYLALLVWPNRLSIDHSYNQIPLADGSAEDWLAGGVFVALVAAMVWAWRRTRTAFFFGAFALVTFLPASNLLFSTGTIMAERLMYLPSCGVTAVFVMALFSVGRALEPARSEAPALRFTQSAIVVIVVVAFAARTWMRNRDWRDDVTLWSAAVAASPNSAKAHRALAEALYDADPMHTNIDRAIAEGEQSVAMLATLPDDLSSFQSYRQVAAYYLDKASELQRTRGGNLAERGDVRDAYQKALGYLQRGQPILAASRRRAGGESGRTEADAHRLLAVAYLGIENARQALDHATEARRLDPLHPLAHRLVASALLAEDRAEEAAVALMVGSLMAADVASRDQLVRLYRSGLDASGCAVTTGSDGDVLNPSCPIVHRHLCAATVEAIAENVAIGRHDEADRLRRVAQVNLGCAL